MARLAAAAEVVFAVDFDEGDGWVRAEEFGVMRGAQAAVKALTTPDGETHVHTLSGGTQTNQGAY